LIIYLLTNYCIFIMAMEIDKKSITRLWVKLIVFFEREMVFTLRFWLVVFLVVFIMKLLRLGKH
jgi:hypothetical protein